MAAKALSDAALKESIAAWEKCGRVAADAAKVLGINESSMRKRLQRARARFGALKPGPSAVTAKQGRSLDDFRSQHDKDFIVPRRLRDALKALGPSNWEYEAQFARLASVGLADLATYREQFEEYVVVLGREGKRAWAGSPNLATKMRSMVR